MAAGGTWHGGLKLRQVRHARRKSLRTVAELAGISESYLSRLETGVRALDRRSLIVKLAAALEVAPTELVEAPVSLAPGEFAEDGALSAVRVAMLAVSMGEPRGEALPVAALSARAEELLADQRDCRYDVVGRALPGLIRDLHTTLAAGRDEAAVLRLLTLVHVQGTQAWLMDIGAPLDLGWQAATLARQAAERLDQPLVTGLSTFGTAFGLLGAGAFDLAAQSLAQVRVGIADPAAIQVTGMLALTSSLVAAASGDRSGRVAALDHAAELANQVGEGNNAMWFGFGPSNVGVWRMAVALEAGEHAEAERIAQTVNPELLSSPTRQAAYWRDRGRALARLPKRQHDAVQAIRRAERISPARVHRHPFMRSLLAEMVSRAKRDAVGRELRGLASRAGLPV